MSEQIVYLQIVYTDSILAQVSEQIRTCIWVGDCLLYTSTAGRLNYTVGGEVPYLYLYLYLYAVPP